MVTTYTDDGYWIGDLREAVNLCEKMGIAPENRHPDVKPGDLRPCSIGFCEADQKWYRWSHRAIYGFGIGSEIKKGDCGYQPVDFEDARRAAVEFWSSDYHRDTKADPICHYNDNGVPYVKVTWVGSDTIPNEKMRGQPDGATFYEGASGGGRGEWTAETLDDARQMACDFAESCPSSYKMEHQSGLSIGGSGSFV